MTTPFKLTRVASLKTVADFRAHCAGLGVDLPLEDAIEAGAGNPLSQPIARTQVNGKTIGNRIASHPMEGWDGTTTGGIAGSWVTCTVLAAAKYYVTGVLLGSGTIATPFADS